MNTTAQLQSIVSTINSLINKVIEIEKDQKKLEEKLNEVPTIRDVEQIVAKNIIGKIDRTVSPVTPTPCSIEGMLASGGGSGMVGADIDFTPTTTGVGESIEIVSPTEKKKSIKKKK